MSLDYDNAQTLEMITSDLVWADWRRGFNRALINSLANGDPPYTEEEAESANLKVNYNNLKLCNMAHQGRQSFFNGFFQQGAYLTCQTDMGPKHKRQQIQATVEREANLPLIKSIEYYEAMQSKFALLVLHGISPSLWRNSYEVIPECLSIGDLLCPTNTLRGFRNLPILTVRKSFTAKEFVDLTNAAKRDPGWNMDFVKKCLRWVDREMKGGLSTSINEYYKPEKWGEEKKQDGGWYMADRVPTIDVFDVYAYVEGTEKNKSGWVRRIMIDSWSNSGPSTGDKPEKRQRDIDKTGKDDFIFSSRLRPVAETWQQIVSVQYGDLSAVAPFMHNAVRGAGWFNYAKCHVANRFDCRFYDSAFEQLMQYFRVESADDVQRAMKVELANMGFIDPTIKMIPQAERWQPNAQFIELAMQQNKQDIEEGSRGWTNQTNQSNARTEKTKAQYIAELQQMSAMVSAALNQAYMYQVHEDREIFRRLMIPNSKDPISRRFRENCLRKGVPENLMNAEAWDIQHEKMMGQGNQTLEMMVAQELLQMAPGMPPESQTTVKRNFVVALTHNPQMAIDLFPESPAKVTNGTEEASRVMTAFLSGVPADMLPGTNPIEYIEAGLKILGGMVKQGMQKGMVAPDKLQGMQAMGQNLGQHIQQLAQDKTQEERVKKYAKELGELMNEIKAFGQRLQAAMKKQAAAAQKNGGGDGGEGAAKSAAVIIGAKTKAATQKALTAQKLHHNEQKFQQGLKHEAIKTRAGIAKTDLETAASIRRGGLKTLGYSEE